MQQLNTNTNTNTKLIKLMRNLHNKGLPIIPVSGKRAFTQGWSFHATSMPNKEQHEYYLSKISKGIGIVLGPKAGVIGIDIDSKDKEVVDQIRDLLPSTPISKIGEKGMTLFYKYNKEKNEKIMNGKQPIVELLSSGCQSVLPPSIHPNTNKPYFYNSIGDFETIDVKTLPFLPKNTMSTLRNMLSKTTNIAKSSDTSISEGRNEKLKSIATAMLYEKKNIQKIADHLITYDKKYHSLPLFSDKTEGICKADANSNAMSFIVNILQSINREKESQDILIPGSNQLKDIKEIDVLSLGELLEEGRFPDPIPLVEGLMNKQEFHLLSAPAKCGKTILQINLAVSIAKGVPFLGVFKTFKGKVLILQTEVSGAHFKKRLETIIGDGIYDIKDQILTCNERIKLNTPEGIESLRLLLEKYIPDLIILDPFYTLHNCNEDSSSDIAPILSDLRELIIEIGTACLLIHHQGKSTSNSHQVGHKHRGSSSFADVPDGSWSMARTKDDKIAQLAFELRNQESPDRLQIMLDENMAWKSTGMTIVEPKIVTSNDIAQLLLENGELNSGDLQKLISNTFNVGKSTAIKNIKNAEKLNIIFSRKDGKCIYYSSSRLYSSSINGGNPILKGNEYHLKTTL